jgi:predicted acyltransferase (DUF342 family)
MQITDNVSMLNGLNVSNNVSIIGQMQVSDNVSMFNGLNVSNNTSFVGTLYVSDNVSIFNGLNVSNNVSIVGQMRVSDNVSMFNGINISNNTSLVGTLYVKDNVSMLNGLNVSNNVSIVGQMRVSDNVSMFNGLNVTNNTSLRGRLHVTGNVSMFNGLNVSNNTSLKGTLYVTDITNLQSKLNVNNTITGFNGLDISNNASITGNLYVTESTILMSTLDVTGNVSLLDTLIVTKNTSLLSKLQVTDNAEFMNGINVIANTSLLGKLNTIGSTILQSTLHVDGNASFFSDMNVTGNTFLKGDLTVDATTNLNALITDGSSTFNDLATFTDGINVTNGATFSDGIESDKLYTTGNASINGKLLAGILVYGEIRSITGYNAFSGPAIILGDFTGKDEKGDDVYAKGNATFGGTGDTTINNNLRINSQSIEIHGKGSTNGIMYEGPINISNTGGATDKFNYEGPFNISTVGSDNSIKCQGNLTLSGNLRIKSGYNLFIESTDNSITEIKTETKISNDLKITNEGTGPALILNQVDSFEHDIAHFQDSGNNVIVFGSNGNTTMKGALKVGYTPLDYPYTFDSNGATLDISGACSISGDLNLVGNVISQSDRRIKTNINPIYNCLEKIDTISGYRYNRIDLNDEKHIGLIAQEVEELFPELVTETNNIKGINYQGFIAVLLNCIKELNKKIENIENRK